MRQLFPNDFQVHSNFFIKYFKLTLAIIIFETNQATIQKAFEEIVKEEFKENSQFKTEALEKFLDQQKK